MQYKVLKFSKIFVENTSCPGFLLPKVEGYAIFY